ncbi:MAG: hypothetical protein CUN52_05810 [Phototrophicales bacterium]|nr:MAG: hypothetical protein CUN52_05810 [Phototrophicales bacterium]
MMTPKAPSDLTEIDPNTRPASRERPGRSRRHLPNRLPADHAGVLLASLAMVGVGGVGLATLFSIALPRIGAELWLYFLFIHLLVTGITLPVVRFVNMRFTPLTAEPPSGGILVRQSVWLGLFAVITVWLQILRGLSLATIFLLALVFIVLEVFLQMRERNANY